jgi:transposase-like protein
MTGRKWTAEEKLAIVLEGIKGAQPVAEICREHRIAQTQYYQWRDRFLEGGKRALTERTAGNRGGPHAGDRQAAATHWETGGGHRAVQKTDDLVWRR